MANTFLPDLTEPEARVAVVEAVLALLQRWELHEANQARLLGIDDISAIKPEYLRTGDANLRSPSMESALQCAGHLLAIDRMLQKRFRQQPALRDRWIFTPNQNLDKLTPLSVMLDKGLRGIEVVREIVETG